MAKDEPGSTLVSKLQELLRLATPAERLRARNDLHRLLPVEADRARLRALKAARRAPGGAKK